MLATGPVQDNRQRRQIKKYADYPPYRRGLWIDRNGCEYRKGDQGGAKYYLVSRCMNDLVQVNAGIAVPGNAVKDNKKDPDCQAYQRLLGFRVTGFL